MLQPQGRWAVADSQGKARGRDAMSSDQHGKRNEILSSRSRGRLTDFEVKSTKKTHSLTLSRTGLLTHSRQQSIFYLTLSHWDPFMHSWARHGSKPRVEQCCSLKPAIGLCPRSAFKCPQVSDVGACCIIWMVFISAFVDFYSSRRHLHIIGGL